MSESIVRKWGKTLAIRVPMDIARTIGLTEGEIVEVESEDGDILIRRRAAHARGRQDAEKAAAEIIENSRLHSLDGLSVRDLLDDGRRG